MQKHKCVIDENENKNILRLSDDFYENKLRVTLI
jgi:hypothetical protein